MRKLREFLPHLSIALSLGLITITILDGFNPMMAFLTSESSKVFIYCACAAAILSGIECTAAQRRRPRRKRSAEAPAESADTGAETIKN